MTEEMGIMGDVGSGVINGRYVHAVAEEEIEEQKWK